MAPGRGTEPFSREKYPDGKVYAGKKCNFAMHFQMMKYN